MKICFATHDGVVLSKGGPYTKIIEIRKKLIEKGIEVDLFNQWDTKVK